MIHVKDQKLGQNVRKSFSGSRFDYPLPNLVEIQTKSYKWFLEEGLREVFSEATAITDYNGNLVLEFLDYRFDEKPKYTVGGAASADLITDTIICLAERKMGALIAIERGISLRGYEATGVSIDSIFSTELVTTIFTPPLPLHDGGMILRNGRIAAAHSVFPVSNNPTLTTFSLRCGLKTEFSALFCLPQFLLYLQ